MKSDTRECHILIVSPTPGMCSQIKSKAMESILVVAKEVGKQRIGHAAASGGAQDDRLVKAPRRPHGYLSGKGCPRGAWALPCGPCAAGLLDRVHGRPGTTIWACESHGGRVCPLRKSADVGI